MSIQARDQFDAVAQSYLTSAVHAQGEDLRWVTQRMAGQTQAVALDLGCGAGHLSFAMAPCVRPRGSTSSIEGKEKGPSATARPFFRSGVP
jgi:hypothetical protein